MLTKESKEQEISNTINLSDDFEKGQVYTPTFLAIWVAELLKEHLGKHWSGKLLDPACGDGELLNAVADKLPNSKLHGIDIDVNVTRSARSRLGRSATIRTADMLESLIIKNDESEKNEKNEKSEENDESGEKQLTFNALISNPPWGADLLHSRTSLKQSGYSLANGQFDSWSLFVEASLNVLEHGGVAAFILPDAIFSSEHTATRAFIADNFSIELIARLGEGIFRGICRGTTVLVIRKEVPEPNHLVEVFRLTRSQRNAVMSGCVNLQDARIRDRHYVGQSRFVSDSRTRWDIDVRFSDEGVLGRMESLSGNWSEQILPGRGVELSKKGLVKTCNHCGYAIPAPTRPRVVVCADCGKSAYSDEMPTDRIVVSEQQNVPGFMPFIVGEDINRYGLSCSRQIKLDVPGINYKDQEIFSRERLLVRKTGVGLKATVTKKVAASNQVVFHYVPRSRNMSFYLYYVLGVLSSRIMFAYHLRKSGENEWRSHPYVTPKSLAILPIPTPSVGTRSWRQALEIARRVKMLLRYRGSNKKLDLDLDLQVEGLVAGLYHFDRSDLGWVKQVICDAQDLEPMRVLGSFDINSIPVEMVP